MSKLQLVRQQERSPDIFHSDHPKANFKMVFAFCLVEDSDSCCETRSSRVQKHESVKFQYVLRTLPRGEQRFMLRNAIFTGTKHESVKFQSVLRVLPRGGQRSMLRNAIFTGTKHESVLVVHLQSHLDCRAERCTQQACPISIELDSEGPREQYNATQRRIWNEAIIFSYSEYHSS